MSAARDAEMQAEHGFLWDALIRTAAVDLAGRRVLDAGCNQGGFLRLLSDRFGIAAGFGYDPAAAAVAAARDQAAGRPLQFEVADTVPPAWTEMDVAFSHEVLYLVHDLPAHAAAIHLALAPGGRYFASIGMHDRNPLIARWHRELARSVALPPIYSLDEVAAALTGAGFTVDVSRFDVRFIPVAGHEEPDLATWVQYYNEDKLLFRATRSG
jgi:SAM-dependent methyltransferase